MMDDLDACAFCPACGYLRREEIDLFRRDLRRQLFFLSPILPRCRRCHAEVRMAEPASPLSVVCLTGTCGSGKSAVAEELVRAFGYLAVDGDCAMQAYRHRAGGVGAEYDAPEFLAELTDEVAAVGRFSTRVALAHIAPTPVAGQLRALFARRGWRTLFVLLRPSLETALQRSRSPTCHSHATPEKWVRHFHALCAPEVDDTPSDTRLLDNGAQTASGSAATIHDLAEAYLPRYRFSTPTPPGTSRPPCPTPLRYPRQREARPPRNRPHLVCS